MDHKTVLMCPCFHAKAGMFLVAYKVAELLGLLGGTLLIMALSPVWYFLIEATLFEAAMGRPKGRIRWIWSWPIFLWATWKIFAGIGFVCVPDYLGCFILHKPP